MNGILQIEITLFVTLYIETSFLGNGVEVVQTKTCFIV